MGKTFDQKHRKRERDFYRTNLPSVGQKFGLPHTHSYQSLQKQKISFWGEETASQGFDEVFLDIIYNKSVANEVSTINLISNN